MQQPVLQHPAEAEISNEHGAGVHHIIFQLFRELHVKIRVSYFW